MPQQILQVNFKFSIPRAEAESAWLGAAQPIADTPGLKWKIWLMNEAENEAGGIYLFENEAAAQSYLAGPMVAALKASPVVSDISAKLFGALGEHSAITRAPLNPTFTSANPVMENEAKLTPKAAAKAANKLPPAEQLKKFEQSMEAHDGGNQPA